MFCAVGGEQEPPEATPLSLEYFTYVTITPLLTRHVTSEQHLNEHMNSRETAHYT